MIQYESRVMVYKSIIELAPHYSMTCIFKISQTLCTSFVTLLLTFKSQNYNRPMAKRGSRFGPPQGDGLSEAMVKNLKFCVQKQVDQYESNWGLYLQPAVYAILSSVNDSTKVTFANRCLIPSFLYQRLLVQPSAAHHV